MGIEDGVIVRIGPITEEAIETIDADGQVVALVLPIPIPTSTYSCSGTSGKPAIEHGVDHCPAIASIFAPLEAEHSRIGGMFNQIEEMPHALPKAGNWESFEEFGANGGPDINVAPVTVYCARVIR